MQILFSPNEGSQIALLSQEGSGIASRSREGWFQHRNVSASEPPCLRYAQAPLLTQEGKIGSLFANRASTVSTEILRQLVGRSGLQFRHSIPGGFMFRKSAFVCILCVVLAATATLAQSIKTIPRPPAQPAGAPATDAGSAAPDGYAPIPQWPGQTRAPHPAKTEAYSVSTFAEGLNGGFCFSFLPDGRIIVGERPGRIRIVDKNGRVSDPIDGLPTLWARGQGLFDVRLDKDFATNRTIYLSYTVLPAGTSEASPPRFAGVLKVARARLSADDKRIENIKVLLDAEGTGGRVIQAPDGTLFVTASIPAGIGIN